jgi:hypothetical protein
MALVSTHPGIIPEGKGGRGVGVTTLPASCSDCHKIWDLQLPGTLMAYTSTDLFSCVNKFRTFIV